MLVHKFGGAVFGNEEKGYEAALTILKSYAEVRPIKNEPINPAEQIVEKIEQGIEKLTQDISNSITNSISNSTSSVNKKQMSTISTSKFPQIAIVSAMQGITDKLISAAKKAIIGDSAITKEVEDIAERHLKIAKLLFGQSSDNESKAVYESFIQQVNQDTQDIFAILKALELCHLPNQEYIDCITSYGEIWNAQLFCKYLKSQGLSAIFLDAREVLCVEIDANSEFPNVNWKVTEEKMKTFLNSIDQNVNVLVVTGYIAKTTKGITTTLKRKGSDFSASIFGYLLKADKITFWSNFDGISSANPSIVKGAQHLPEITYAEALEFSFYGSDIVHPRSVYPAIEAGIPIWIRNIFNLSCSGTKIHSGTLVESVDHLGSHEVVKGLVSKDHVALITMIGAQITIGEYSPLSERNSLLLCLQRNNITVFMTLYAAAENTLTLAISEGQSVDAKKIMEDHFSGEITKKQIVDIKVSKGLAILTAIGEHISQVSGIASLFFTALQRKRINVVSVAQNGERIISCVIKRECLNDGLQCVHSVFKNPMDTLTIGIIGATTNLTTTNFIKLVQKHQQERRKTNHRYNLDILAICGNQQMSLDVSQLWNETQFSPQSLEKLLQNSPPLVFEEFITHLTQCSGYHKVIVDCSDNSKEYCKFYPKWLSLGFHIVTANSAFLLDSDLYDSIMSAKNDTTLHYEEALIPSFPLVDKVNEIFDFGSKIILIEGILESSLNSLLNDFSPFDGSVGLPFEEVAEKYFIQSKVVYSPDFIIRKICSLARVCGFLVNSSDVECERLFPKDVNFENGTCTNPQKFQETANSLNQKKEQARAEGKVLRYLASINVDGVISIQLRSISKEHIFAKVQPNEIVLSFTTNLFSQPFTLRTEGEFEGLGLFSDILKVAFLSKSR